jgi:signal recognition particle subunit SRP72
MAPKTSQRSVPLSKATGKKSKAKPIPKEPLSTSERLKRLFSSLCAQIDGGHYNNAVKTCDKSAFSILRFQHMVLSEICCLVLRIEPKDQDALQTKLFLLLQTEQYNSALALIDANDEYAFERAYSLYRVNQEQGAREALEVTKKQKGEDDRGAIHLEAQMVQTCPYHENRSLMRSA